MVGDGRNSGYWLDDLYMPSKSGNNVIRRTDGMSVNGSSDDCCRAAAEGNLSRTPKYKNVWLANTCSTERDVRFFSVSLIHSTHINIYFPRPLFIYYTSHDLSLSLVNLGQGVNTAHTHTHQIYDIYNI